MAALSLIIASSHDYKDIHIRMKLGYSRKKREFMTNLFDLWIFFLCFVSQCSEIILQNLQEFLHRFITLIRTYKRHDLLIYIVSTD